MKADFINRIAVSVFSIGILAPAAAALLGEVHVGAWALVATFVTSFALNFTLHYIALR